MGEDELLKGVDLVLERHEISDCLVPVVELGRHFQDGGEPEPALHLDH